MLPIQFLAGEGYRQFRTHTEKSRMISLINSMRNDSISANSQCFLRHAMRVLFAIAIMIIAYGRVEAGPFIKIDKTDCESEFPNVKIFVSVNSQGLLSSQTFDEESISLYEDGYRVNYVSIKQIAEGDSFLYYVFSIDTSKSIRKASFKKAKVLAKGIIGAARDGDTFSVYRFNDEVKLLTAFTQSRSEVIQAIDSMRLQGSKTLLYNALYDSINLLDKSKKEHKSLVVFTDSIDEGSSVSEGDVIKLAGESGIPINVVLTKGVKSSRALARMAKITGGLYINDPSRINGEQVYKTIRNSMGRQYLLKYRTLLSPGDKSHLIEVRMRAHNLNDRDSTEIVYKSWFNRGVLSSISNIALIILIAVLIVFFIAAVVYFIQRGGFLSKKQRDPPAVPLAYGLEFEKAMAIDEQTRRQSESLITPQDTEYVYAKSWLVEKDGPDAGKKFPIFWEEMTIGRDEENGIVVADEAVSLKHAKIKRIRNAYLLFDLVSENGTFLNDKKLLRPKPLYDWDEIRIGRTLFIFRGSKIA